jgi:hypothetical protein
VKFTGTPGSTTVGDPEAWRVSAGLTVRFRKVVEWFAALSLTVREI